MGGRDGQGQKSGDWAGVSYSDPKEGQYVLKVKLAGLDVGESMRRSPLCARPWIKFRAHRTRMARALPSRSSQFRKANRSYKMS